MSSFEMHVFQVACGHIEFLFIFLLEVISFHLFKVVSKNARIPILSLESHVCGYLRTCIIQLIQKLGVHIFNLFDVLGCIPKTSLFWVLISFLTRILRCPQNWRHELLVRPLMHFALSIIHMEKWCFLEVLNLSLVVFHLRRIMWLDCLHLIEFIACFRFKTHARAAIFWLGANRG